MKIRGRITCNGHPVKGRRVICQGKRSDNGRDQHQEVLSDSDGAFRDRRRR